jgi:hypothetical protein
MSHSFDTVATDPKHHGSLYAGASGEATCHLFGSKY